LAMIRWAGSTNISADISFLAMAASRQGRTISL
jgi:hypothetical protein